MPEPYWPKRKGSFTLHDAANAQKGEIAMLRCAYCKVTRYYRLEDLLKVFGPIECDDVPYRMRCTGCGDNGNMNFSLESPTAAQRQGMVIRRIDRIYYVRRVVWRDEKA